MATITKRGNTYRILTSCGYSVDGKQVIKFMSYKPREGMSEKQTEKEVRWQAVLFEESCKKGQAVMPRHCFLSKFGLDAYDRIMKIKIFLD